MAIQGLIGTGEAPTFSNGVVADERPKNWREGILMRFPNGHAPIVALSSKMKKKVTDDPEFNWWEREVSNVRLQLGADLDGTGGNDDVNLAPDPFGFGAGFQVKKNDLLYVEQTGEILRVRTVSADDGAAAINVERAFGDVAATAVTVASDNPNMVVIGSAFAEGDDTPESVRYRATKVTNYTQIFRDSLKATGTAMQTRLRTMDEVRDAKQQTLLYHSIRQEYATIFGNSSENADETSGQPQRTSGGIISYIPAANIQDESGGATAYNTLENYMLEAFRFGSQEKMGFIGNRALLTIQRLIRLSTGFSMELTPATKEFGMDVRRLFTPYGTLVLKTHPLFNQVQSDVGNALWSFDSWLLVVDMANLVYRPMKNRDTQYLPDRQGNGVDGITSEYLTEAGFEVHHGKTHYLIKGLHQANAEPDPIPQA